MDEVRALMVSPKKLKSRRMTMSSSIKLGTT